MKTYSRKQIALTLCAVAATYFGTLKAQVGGLPNESSPVDLYTVGLMAEEVELDYAKAARLYQSVIEDFDARRQKAANAVFRLGECLRKLRLFEEAKVQYARILREFPDQVELTRLSHQLLTQPASATASSGARMPGGTSPSNRFGPSQDRAPEQNSAKTEERGRENPYEEIEKALKVAARLGKLTEEEVAEELVKLGKMTENEVERKWDEEFRDEAQADKERVEKKEKYEAIVKNLNASMKAGRMTAMEAFKKAGDAAGELGGATEKKAVAKELAKLGKMTENEVERKWEKEFRNWTQSDKENMEEFVAIVKNLSASMKAGRMTAMEAFKEAGEAAVKLGTATEKEVAEDSMALRGIDPPLLRKSDPPGEMVRGAGLSFPRSRESFPSSEARGSVRKDRGAGVPGGAFPRSGANGFLLRRGGEHEVPVSAGRPKPLDGGMKGEHGAGGSIAGGVSIKAAIDRDALVNEGPQPLGIGTGPGGRDTAIVRMEGKATDGVDG